MTKRFNKAMILLLQIAFVSCNQKDPKDSVVSSEEIPHPAVSETNTMEYFAPTNSEFCGVYLPDLYIEQVKLTKSHSKAIHSPSSKYYNLLSVNPDIIYSDEKWHDGFAISQSKGNKFVFYDSTGLQKIKDDNGYTYTQISKDYKNAYREIDKFITQTLFSEMIEHGQASINDLGIEIKGHQFKVVLDDMFYPKSFDALLFEQKTKKVFGVELTDSEAKYFSLLNNPDDIEALIGPQVEL